MSTLTAFPSPIDFADTVLEVDYSPGSGTMKLAPGSGAIINQRLAANGRPSISPTAPIQYAVVNLVGFNPAANQASQSSFITLYQATGLTIGDDWDTFTGVVAIESTTDQAFQAGAPVQFNLTAAILALIFSAINALESGGGSSGNATSLQGNPIATTAPTTNQGLGWNGADWTPFNFVVSTGITNGQTVIGDLIPSGTLTLSSTADPTKGQVQIIDGSKFLVTSAPLNPAIFGGRLFTVQDVSTVGQIRSTTTGAHSIFEFYATGLTSTNANIGQSWLINDTGGTVRGIGGFGLYVTNFAPSSFTSVARWRVATNAALPTATMELSGSALYCGANLGLSLGTSGVRWSTAWVQNVDASGTLNVAGAATIPVIKGSGSNDILELEDSSSNKQVVFDASGFGLLTKKSFVLSSTPQGGTPQPLAAGTDVTPHTPPMPFAGKIVKASAVAKTGPTGADLVFDILKSSDNVSFTSIWATTPSNRLKIANGTTTGSQAAFDTTAVAAGDVFRIDIITVGSVVPGNDVVVELTILSRNQ